MHDREQQNLSRRDFMQLAVYSVGSATVVLGVGAAIELIRQGGETQEVDPFAESDQANKELIQAMIAASESNILEDREMAESEFNLFSPRIMTLVELNIQPFTPDVDFGILSDSNGQAYALIYNHDMDCVREPLSNAGLIGETFIQEGPAKGTVFDPGISEIYFTETDLLARPENLTVERFIDNYRIEIDGNEVNLPILIVKGFSLNGESYDCATIQEKVGGRAGEILRRVQNGLSNVELSEILESAGSVVGSVLGNFAQGTGRGLRDAFND